MLGLISGQPSLVSADAEQVGNEVAPIGMSNTLGAAPLAEGKEITVSLPTGPIFVTEGDGTVEIPVTFRLTGDTDTFSGAIVIYQAEGSSERPAVSPGDWEYDPILQEGDEEIYSFSGFVLTDPVRTESIRLPIVDDQKREGDETLVVSIGSPHPGNPTRDSDLRFILEPSSVLITILDNDSPAQLTGLTLMRDGSQVMLRWDEPGDATIIKHQYTEDGGRNWIDVPDSAPGENNATSYTVSGLAYDVDYSFAVRAVNSTGNVGHSVASDVVTAGSRTDEPARASPEPTPVTAPLNPETNAWYEKVSPRARVGILAGGDINHRPLVVQEAPQAAWPRCGAKVQITRCPRPGRWNNGNHETSWIICMLVLRPHALLSEW